MKELVRHLARIALTLAAGAWAAAAAPELLPAVSVALVLAAFTLQHDLIHGSLGITRRLRDPLLSLVGATMLMSGHGTRIMHLLHHRRLFSRDDLEGITATVPLPRAIAMIPGLLVRYRREAWRRASARERRWIAAENALNLLTLIALLASGAAPLMVHGVVALVMVVSVPIWAGRIPHHTPGWLMGLARKLTCTRSPTVLSLASHDLHHRRPHVPCARLAD